MNQVTYLKQREGETIPELAKRIAEAHEDMRQKHPEIISRAEAKAQGLKYYFTGKPCKNGCFGNRYVSDCKCTCEKCKLEKNKMNLNCYYKKIDDRKTKAASYRDKNRENIRQRDREYYAANKEKRSDSQKKSYEKHKQKRNAESRRWAKENPKLINEFAKRYRANNKEKINKSNAEYRRKNRDTINKRLKEWHSNHPGYKNSLVAKRRAEQRQAIPSWFNEFDEFAFQQAYELAALRQQETGIEWHVDHMIPLRARKCCGLHCADNIQVIPAEMNLEKSNKMQLTKPLEWLK